ncbi:phosphoglycolate phosphatase [Ruminococcus sp. YE71]|uniref:HAD family hydrolase n=1 Tax=unclassified Ruminococcus TaxID=2608920 RepID=UPI00088497DE|nr:MULTISPECIES: HAD family hydrolase [unclassified Ruminococcus]SDA21045.1 phosphoglycolate phosphatase [Ruminococcus sp. YE78]SFW33110.1 phosphoglycolate phosphatase [Ruminococcus sp. YE71]
MKKYKACIFDFDLTLADSSKGILICFRHTLEQFGYPVPDDRTIYNTIGMPLTNAFDLLSGIPDNPNKEAMRKVYIRKADDVMVKYTFFYDGVIEGLKRLREHGVKVGICSSKMRYRIVESFEEKAGCLPVDVLIGLGDTAKPKPDPGSLFECISQLGLDKSEILYVGDNIIDAQTAQNADVDFGAVLTGSTVRGEFEKLPNVVIAERLTDILSFVDET